MESVISVGSICFVNQRFPFEKIQNGDIISFVVGEEMFVTHRAVYIDNGEPLKTMRKSAVYEKFAKRERQNPYKSGN